MILLALETSSSAAAVALSDDGRVLQELTTDAPRRHVETLHPLIDALFSTAGRSLGDLSAVAADIGPGLFTGIRVGVAAAKAMAMALSLPTVGVTSLEVLVHAAVGEGVTGEIVPVVDLKRGEVAWQLDGARAFGPPSKLIEATFGRHEVVMVGDGAEAYRDELSASGLDVGEPVGSPPVASLAVLAGKALVEGRSTDPSELVPLYLREADARINWTTRHDAGSATRP